MNNLSDQKLLVIAPHSDDEVLGCGGLISKVKKSGGKVFVLIFNLGFSNCRPSVSLVIHHENTRLVLWRHL